LFSMDLLLDAVVIGVLLGCFYAAVSLGLSVSFGLLDVPHVAHPAFLVLASYGVFLLNERFGIDPLLAGLLITPLLFLFGLAAYRLYYETFEKRGSDAGVRGIAFFRTVYYLPSMVPAVASADVPPDSADDAAVDAAQAVASDAVADAQSDPLTGAPLAAESAGTARIVPLALKRAMLEINLELRPALHDRGGRHPGRPLLHLPDGCPAGPAISLGARRDPIFDGGLRAALSHSRAQLFSASLRSGSFRSPRTRDGTLTLGIRGIAW